MKTDLVYSDETLFVNLEGRINRKEIRILKNKILNIINEYQINDVIINTKNIINSNFPYLEELLNNYEFNDLYIKMI